MFDPVLLRGAALLAAALLSTVGGSGCSMEVEIEPFERDLPDPVEAAAALVEAQKRY